MSMIELNFRDEYSQHWHLYPSFFTNALEIIRITPPILVGHHLWNLYCTLSINTPGTKVTHLYHPMQNNVTLNEIDQVSFSFLYFWNDGKRPFFYDVPSSVDHIISKLRYIGRTINLVFQIQHFSIYKTVQKTTSWKFSWQTIMSSKKIF